MENSESDFIHLEAANLTELRRAMLSHAHERMILAMLVSDLVGILTAVLLASLVRWVVLGPLTTSAYSWVPAYLVIFVIATHLRGLYPAVGMSAVEQFRHLTITTTLFFLVIIAGTFIFQISTEFSRLLLGLSWLFCLVTIPFNRTLIRHLMAKVGLWGEPVAVIGRAEGAKKIASYYQRYPKIGLRPEAIISLNKEMMGQDPEARAWLIQNIEKLKVSTSIKIVVVVYDKLEQFATIREAFRDQFEKVVLIAADDHKLDLGGMNVRQYGNLLTFEIRHSLVDRSAQFQKRVIDLCVAGLGIILLSPLLALISLLIVLDSPGGVFYHQRRLGKGGKEFGMLKFRTMKQDADAVLRDCLAQNPEWQHEWDSYQKLLKDPRITRVGRLLRRFSLDELPQLWNVLLGEMSIVGPRPIMVNQQKMYGENYRHYVRVTPGITGLWQISGRNHTSFAQRAAFDREYVNDWSIWVDIHIIVRTAWVVLHMDGAF